jgi:hypothetical protein
MKKLIIVNLAGHLLLISLTLLAIFHILIIFQMIPTHMIWGGQFNEFSSNLMLMEFLALIILFIFFLIILVKMGYFRLQKYGKIVDTGMWIIVVYFVLNTIGNLASSVPAEKWIFTPITILISIFALVLAVGKKQNYKCH